ncbi:hypothetical protein E4631_06585 [Hymenobacter sp. UV11]|uniref:hypothetical protein n=1 Tax=Hymenobacter sp. UV11 TaxID=1849735 RepID=UPI00105F3727|nr:hypothetical protein [Hymenobacter sp. UV11]TDN38187.1 hypothetical protein A8B98_24555 [Hymenobacter sp. UV11]TFZ67640.1 hypothetical protein E4631_06585 [Hymenobacter sp. UV11]
MKTLLLAGLLAAAGAAHGQEYYIDLHKEPLEVPGRTVAVESVVDGRRSPQIGVMSHGGQARPATIFFREGAATELTAFMQARLPARPTDYPVVLCLRQLQLTEMLSDGASQQTPPWQSDTDLAFDVYAHQPDGYRFVQRVAGHWGGSSYQSALYFSTRLARLLGYCLGQVAQADWAGAAQQPARTLAQLATDAPTPLPAAQAAAAILREAPRRGLYRSFAQFVANQPDTTLAFRLDTVADDRPSRYQARQVARWWWAWWHVARVRPVVGAGRGAVPPGIWGFCDGQQLFIEQEDKFYPLNRYNDFFTFVREAAYNMQYQAYLSQKPAQRLSQNPMLTTPVPGGEPLTLALDPRTGEVGSFPGLRPRREDTAYVYLYRPPQARNLNAMRVLVNGRETARLYPGGYCRLTCLHPVLPLRLSLEGVGPPDGPAQMLLPNPAQPLYLEITPLAAGNRYWRWVPKAQGQAALQALVVRQSAAR